LLVTTPSYAFNTLFTPPDGKPTGFLDPTNRTTRFFRHIDHKFEWTPSEWRAYCEESAALWGYDVKIGGIGYAQEPDPWGRKVEGGFATQVACFRRKEGSHDNEHRKQYWEEWTSAHRIDEGKHEVLQKFAFPAHLSSGKPCEPSDVLQTVFTVMQTLEATEVEFRELWNDVTVTMKCGGMREILVRVLEEDEEGSVSLKKGNTKDAEQWLVEASGEAGTRIREYIEKARGKRDAMWRKAADTHNSDEDCGREAVPRILEERDEENISSADPQTNGWESVEADWGTQTGWETGVGTGWSNSTGDWSTKKIELRSWR
jgi:small RNA 2'-O-methyltransferase